MRVISPEGSEMVATVSLYKCPDGTDFPVTWEDPEDEKQGWYWDQLHCPTPLTPLSAELWPDIYEGFTRAGVLLGSLARFRSLMVNGYNFTRPEVYTDYLEMRTAVARWDIETRGSRLLELWRSQYLPEVETHLFAIRALAGSGPGLRDLAARLPLLRAARVRLGELHTFALGLAGGAAGRLIRMCVREFGAEGELIATDLMGGFSNKSLESSLGLWDLAQAAKEMPAVEKLLRTGSAADFLARVDEVDGGPEFREQLGAYLEVYGHRNESFSELSYPTWREDPRFPLLMVRRFIDTPPDASPAAMHARTTARRERRLEEVSPKLSANPEQWDAFQMVLKDAQQRTVLLEDHNFYIDQAGPSATREYCLALGEGLAAAGVIAAARDVFYLTLTEIEAAASGERANMSATVEERRAERETWLRVLPPATIGSGDVQMPEQMVQFFGPVANEPMGEGAFKGVAGSPGVIRATARLILGLDDIDRLAPGEVLVTYATAPPWTPAFAIAGAVVTDVGGTLSHCAVVAREYGIPAVVGTRVATATIRDGQLITVDGTSGVVRLEE